MELPDKKKKKKYYYFMAPDEYMATPDAQLPASAVWEGLKERTTSHGIPQVDTAAGMTSCTRLTIICHENSLDFYTPVIICLFSFYFPFPTCIVHDDM